MQKQEQRKLRPNKRSGGPQPIAGIGGFVALQLRSSNALKSPKKNILFDLQL